MQARFVSALARASLGLALLAPSLTLAPRALAATWEIDPAHSSVQFSVRHMTISNVQGEFGKVTGSAEADEQDLTRSKVEATIDVSTINTRQAKRDEHLKSADFLDVAKYPTITFRSTRAEAAGAGKWKLHGDLTLHGVTRQVVLDVDGPTPEMKDPSGRVRAGAHATATINRKDFGILWDKKLDGGGLLVGDEIAVTIDVEAIKKLSVAATTTTGDQR
ncbi:MAG TPA: YceI family protein [Candidatus Bathyarchaeia archaeon]|nr:YceI family protein [Candidatus Bathyarchaeia archaeon]